MPLPLDARQAARAAAAAGEVLCAIANYWEHAQRAAAAAHMFVKNPGRGVGPGDTIELPEFTEPWMFMHEAELALVFRGPSTPISRTTGETPCLATPA